MRAILTGAETDNDDKTDKINENHDGDDKLANRYWKVRAILTSAKTNPKVNNDNNVDDEKLLAGIVGQKG